ncbi:MAG TPA: glycosyltransferase [Oligoflexus sp.]|uniref:glycosyltransferase n=1 Tax=Oligoflexus sp. TaxID=1971216 RepID=UPI002D6B3B85|nr:glycosyltransferase [Oligoflexus sp.]HYX39328.1 glycosyltransferase [Oligoflexus sp.]
MKIGVFFGVYEAEKAFAQQTLGQLLDILQNHDVHVLILDDASPSFLGQGLVQVYAGRKRVTFEVLRNEKSSGFRGAMDRTLFAFRHLSNSSQAFDYVLRVDADLFFNRKDLAGIFESHRLPKQGMIGSFARFRVRDYIQVLADLVPFGFRRRQVNGIVEHKWEFKRVRAVWWWDLGLRALRYGFNREFIGGPFQIIAGSTLMELSRKGWLDRRPLENLGLVFGEDVMSNILVKALNHPLMDLAELVPDWACDMAINPHKGDWQSIQANRYYLVHPLKGDPWGLRLRQELERVQVGHLESV